MRITQPFVGSGMKTNSLDPPPTISYFEQLAKLFGICDSVILFFFFPFDCDIVNVNPIMASQLSLYTIWDHHFFFLFCMEKGGTNKRYQRLNGGELTPIQ
jgi:hypothetical protein